MSIFEIVRADVTSGAISCLRYVEVPHPLVLVKGLPQQISSEASPLFMLTAKIYLNQLRRDARGKGRIKGCFKVLSKSA